MQTLEDLVGKLLDRCVYYSTAGQYQQNQLLEQHEELYSLVEKICSKEKETCINHKRNEYIDRFTKWCFENGLECNKLQIKCLDGSDNYGLVTKQDIEENSQVIRVPKKMMISTETAFEDPILAKFIQQDPLCSIPNLVLALHIINEYSKTDSFWKFYLRILPTSYSTPLYFRHQEIQYLKGSIALYEAVNLCRNIYRQYAYFWKKITSKNSPLYRLPLRKNFTFNTYRWAVSTIMTRQNQFPSSRIEYSTICTLVPFWDFCNHKQGKLSTDYDKDINSAVCYAMDNFKSGEEFFIFYGKRSNWEFFLHNGFIYEDNKNDFIQIRLGLGNERLLSKKLNLCRKINVSSSGFYKLYYKNYPNDGQLLAFLRIFHMKSDELERWLNTDDFNSLFDANIVLPYDEEVKKYLTTRVNLLLKCFPLIKEDNLSSLGSLAAKLIKCEKMILNSYN